jgi:FtsH-binding integral membrane protein
MGFKCFFGEPFQLLTIPQKKIFALFVIFYKFAPFVLVPIWAYHERNWWILFGIAASQFGIFLAARAAVRGAKSASGGFLPFVFIGLWIATGIRSIETFYSLWALWSWALFLIAEDYQRHCATQNLVASSAVFDDAVTNQKVMIVRRDD